MNTFIQTQIENMTNINSDEKKQFKDQEANPAVKSEKNKKKEKKKKTGSYKKLLRSIKKSKRTEQEQKDAYRERLKQTLGGGNFAKISNI